MFYQGIQQWLHESQRHHLDHSYSHETKSAGKTGVIPLNWVIRFWKSKGKRIMMHQGG